MAKKVVWFENWESADIYQNSLTLHNTTGIAYAVEMPGGRFAVTDDADEMRRLREKGRAVNVIDRRDRKEGFELR